MATKSDGFTHEVGEEVRCSVCFDLFNEPKYLDCLHVFCSGCIDKLNRERATLRQNARRHITVVRCPTCRTPTEIGESGIKKLRPATNIARIAEALKRKEAKVPPARPPTLPAALCSKHRSSLTMCCHTCDMAICSGCISEHNRHDIRALRQTAEMYRSEIERKVQEMQPMADQISLAQEELRTKEHAIKQKDESIKREIDKVINMIQQSGNELKEQVTAQTQDGLDNIASQQADLELKSAVLQSGMEDVKSKLQQRSDIKIYADKLKHATLIQITELRQKVKINEFKILAESDICFIPNNELIQAGIGKVGRGKEMQVHNDLAIDEVQVHEQRELDNAELPQIQARCTGKGSRIAKADKTMSFQLLLSIPPMGPLTCQLVDSNNIHNIPCTIALEGKFSSLTHKSRNSIASPNYTVSYKADYCGVYNIKLQHVGYESIPCQPNTIQIVPSSPEIIAIKSCGIATTRKNTIIISDGHMIKFLNNQKVYEGGFELKHSGKLTRIAVTPDASIIAVGRHSIVELKMNGDLIKQFGSYGKGENMLSSPFDVAVDAGTGRIFVSDSSNNSIKVLNPDLTFSNEFGINGRNEGQFNHPKGIALDSKGVLYVCDTYNSRIQKFKNDSTFIGQFGAGILTKPTCIAVDSYRDRDDGSCCDVVYVLDEGRVLVFTSDGEYTEIQYKLSLIDPVGLIVNELGNLFVCGCQPK